MSASEYIKSKHLPSLQYVADKVGRHRDTINNYYNNDFEFLEYLVLGVIFKQYFGDSLPLLIDGAYVPLIGGVYKIPCGAKFTGKPEDIKITINEREHDE